MNTGQPVFDGFFVKEAGHAFDPAVRARASNLPVFGADPFGSEEYARLFEHELPLSRPSFWHDAPPVFDHNLRVLSCSLHECSGWGRDSIARGCSLTGGWSHPS